MVSYHEGCLLITSECEFILTVTSCDVTGCLCPVCQGEEGEEGGGEGEGGREGGREGVKGGREKYEFHELGRDGLLPRWLTPDDISM